MDTVESIQQWFDLANPEATSKNFHTQLGCHLEEVSEMFQELSSKNKELQTKFDVLIATLNEASTMLKEGDDLVDVLDELAFCDSLCDQVVTSIGTGTYRGYLMSGAIGETNASNFSKFVDGLPVFNENKKIMKGPSYFKPDLKRFI